EVKRVKEINAAFIVVPRCFRLRVGQPFMPPPDLYRMVGSSPSNTMTKPAEPRPLSTVEPSPDQSSYIEDFRRAGHEAVDWIAQYLASVPDLPVLAQTKPGQLYDALPESAPDQGESFQAILRDFDQLVMPAVTQWNHPRFFAYFACTGSTPAVLGEMLAAALNTNGLHWKSSPAVAELEQRTLDWLRQWMGLSGSDAPSADSNAAGTGNASGLANKWFGIVYDTASTSSMHAVVCAREMV